VRTEKRLTQSPLAGRLEPAEKNAERNPEELTDILFHSFSALSLWAF
jgi:hypothetical protein